VHVRRLESLSLQLADCGILVSDSVHLLLLDGGWGNIHAQNDVLDLTVGQRSNIDVVLLSIIR